MSAPSRRLRVAALRRPSEEKLACYLKFWDCRGELNPWTEYYALLGTAKSRRPSKLYERLAMNVGLSAVRGTNLLTKSIVCEV